MITEIVKENGALEVVQPKKEEECRCYTVQDLQKILNVTRSTVYELLKRKEFSWIQIGNGRYRISKKSFDAWLDENF